MQRNLTTRTVGTIRRLGNLKSRYLAAAGAIALVVAAGVGAGIWQRTAHGGNRAVVQHQPAPQPSTGYDSAAVPAPSQPFTVAPQTFTVYLVDSQAAAAELQHELTRFTQKIAGGEPSQNEAILVADSAQERAEARLYVKNLLMDLGPEHVRVVHVTDAAPADAK
jgi:hypothetical protein